MNEIKLDLLEKVEPLQVNLRVSDPDGWIDDWYNSILPEKNKLIFGFKKLDDEFKGKLRSKLCPIIGYGGTKKSLLSQVIAYNNIENSNSKVIYSTMEMGATELINRLINMKCEGEKYNASYELEYHNNITKKIDARDYYKTKFAPVFKDKFFITENLAMTSGLYDKLLTDFYNKNNNIDLLIVDGLGRMGGIGTETERYSRAAMELKNLANKWNILIILICHISKGEKKTCRDLSHLVRSSEKIIDESDFYITMSLFEHKKDDFDKNYGAIRLVNKRGTGNVIDVVYEFDKKRLLMTESDYGFDNFNDNF